MSRYHCILLLKRMVTGANILPNIMDGDSQEMEALGGLESPNLQSDTTYVLIGIGMKWSIEPFHQILIFSQRSFANSQPLVSSCLSHVSSKTHKTASFWTSAHARVQVSVRVRVRVWVMEKLIMWEKVLMEPFYINKLLRHEIRHKYCTAEPQPRPCSIFFSKPWFKIALHVIIVHCWTHYKWPNNKMHSIS